MQKEFILTAFITILARGVPILVLPLLTASLNLEEYGMFAIYLLLINLLAPIITANIAAGVLREGITFPHRGYKLVQLISSYCLALIILTVCAGSLLPIDVNYLYVTILIITFGHQEGLVSFFRSRYRDDLYFWLSLSRAIALVIPAVATFRGYIGLEGLMGGYCLGFLITSLLFTPFSVWRNPINNRHYVYFKITFVYCVFLIPYAVGQWIVSSSTRALLGGISSVESAGLFAISYTMAAPIMLTFSICGVVFGRWILSSPEKWLANSHFRQRVLWGLVGVGFFCTALSMTIVYYDYRYFQLINYYSAESVLITGIISMGLLFQCMYSVYGNILFLKKATKVLAKNSMIIAGLHLFHSYFLITYFNLIGAAVSVWISYLLVCILSFIDAKKETQGSLENSSMDMVIIGIGVVAQVVLVAFFNFHWSVLFK